MHMRKIILILSLIALIMAFATPAGADPWITDGSTATARYNIAIPDAYTFTAHDATFGGAISVGAGTISGGVYDGDWRLAANHWLYSTVGTGGVDLSNETGTFKTPTGVNTFGGIGLFPSTLFVIGTSALNYTTVTDLRAADDGYFVDAFAVGGTAALNVTTATTVTATGLVQGADGRFTDDALVDDDFYVDGTATVQNLVSNTTVAATSADGLTVASVIVPAYETITIPIGASSVDEYVFVADDAWWLVKAEEVHVAAGSEVAPIAANLTIRICDDAEAVTGGVNSTITVIPLNDAANTINTASLNSANAILADGDMIAFDYAGTLTGLRGSVTLTLRRM
jgi:hypothetical protein